MSPGDSLVTLVHTICCFPDYLMARDLAWAFLASGLGTPKSIWVFWEIWKPYPIGSAQGLVSNSEMIHSNINKCKSCKGISWYMQGQRHCLFGLHASPPPNWISSMNNDWSMIKIVIYSECNFYYAYVSTIPKKIGDYSFIAQNYRAS